MSPTSARTAAVIALLIVTVAPASPTASARPVLERTASAEALHIDLDRYERRVIDDITTARRSHDRSPVHAAACLDRLAESWARHLADIGRLVHRDQHRVLRACHLSWAGEALVRGTDLTHAEMVRAWLHSPPHREILLKPRAAVAGMSVVRDRRGRLVGVVNLGDPK